MPEELNLYHARRVEIDAVVSVTTEPLCTVTCVVCAGLAHKVDTEYVVRQWNALPRAMMWTNAPPKQDGWYFMQVRLPGKPVRVVTCSSSTNDT